LKINIENASIPRYRYTNTSHLIRASSDSDVCNEGPTSAIVEFKYNKCDSEDKTNTDSVQTNYYSIVPYWTWKWKKKFSLINIIFNN